MATERSTGDPATARGGAPRGLLDQARDSAVHRLDRQRERAATGLSSVVDAIRQSGHQLEGKNATVASYVDSAAGQMARVVDGLRHRDVNQMITDVERFARQRPGVFLGGAFVLGFVTARFLKSSTRDEEPWRGSTRALQPLT